MTKKMGNETFFLKKSMLVFQPSPRATRRRTATRSSGTTRATGSTRQTTQVGDFSSSLFWHSKHWGNRLRFLVRSWQHLLPQDDAAGGRGDGAAVGGEEFSHQWQCLFSLTKTIFTPPDRIPAATSTRLFASQTACTRYFSTK